MTISEASKEFSLWAVGKNYSPATIQTYAHLISRFVSHLGSDRLVSEIGIMDIVKYNAHLRKSHYADSSVAFMMISIRQLFRFLFLRRIVAWDYELIDIPLYVSKSYRPVEPQEAQAMINQFRGQTFIDKRNKAIIAFLYTSGVRVSELCDLKVTDLKLDKKYAVILTKKGRGKKKRVIFWDEVTHAFLTDYLDHRKLWATDESLFITLTRNGSYTGKKITTRSIERMIASVRVKGDLSPHCFRHGFGFRAVRSNKHMRYIQAFLGHENIRSSQIYADIYDEDTAKEYQSIDHEWSNVSQ